MTIKAQRTLDERLDELERAFARVLQTPVRDEILVGHAEALDGHAEAIGELYGLVGVLAIVGAVLGALVAAYALRGLFS